MKGIEAANMYQSFVSNRFQLASIYVFQEPAESLLLTYREWLADKELPDQSSQLWGSKIVNGKRIEEPPFQMLKELVELDLYCWA